MAPTIDTEQLKLWLQKADCLRHAGQARKAISLYSQIAVEAEKANYQDLLVSALHCAGVAHGLLMVDRSETAHRDAIAFLKAAALCALKKEDWATLAAIYRDAAIVHQRAGRTEKTIADYEKSLSYAKKAEHRSEIAMTLAQEATLVSEKGDTAEADRLLVEAITELHGDSLNGYYLATAMMYRAEVLIKMRRFEQSLDVIQTALSWFESDHNPIQYLERQARLYYLLSRIHQKRENLRLAERSIERYQKLIKAFDPEIVKAERASVDELFD